MGTHGHEHGLGLKQEPERKEERGGGVPAWGRPMHSTQSVTANSTTQGAATMETMTIKAHSKGRP